MARHWPIDPATPVSSGYGWRDGVLHDGTDFAADYGTPVYAAHDGTVSNRLDPGGYGQYVQLDGDGVWTQYGHVRDMWIVPDGTRVIAGTLIAGVGNEGVGTGPHLHFRVRQDGRQTDPLVWLDGAAWGAPQPVDVEALCARFFRDEGFSAAGIAGALANWHAESGFDPAIVEGGGHDLSVIDDVRRSGVGLAQWSFSRREALFAHAAAAGLDWRTTDAQFGYTRAEVASRGDFRELWGRMAVASDPLEASRDFDAVFEGSGVKGSRFATAADFHAKVVAGAYWPAAPQPSRAPVGALVALEVL